MWKVEAVYSAITQFLGIVFIASSTSQLIRGDWIYFLVFFALSIMCFYYAYCLACQFIRERGDRDF